RVDGGTVISGPVVTHTYPAPGSYTALVTASNPVSLLTATTTVRVEQPLSGLSAANDSPTQLGNATLLSATVASGSNPAYAWAFGDGSQGGGAATAHFYPSAGIYTAMVTASNGVSLLTATTVVTIEEGNLYLPLLLRDWSSCFPGPWEEEPNDTLGEANGPLCADIEYLAYPDDPDDYFYFTPAAGQVVVELWDYVPGSLGQMILYDDQGGVAGWDNDLGDGGYIAVTVETGTYWLRVYTAGGFTTDQPYRFSASFPW
ncbi:MAG: PKD domain-containing protein, partial [Anaerolineae bacterium]|nr:PKD domain-containing protein [Anaerolineae bacterium]